MRRRVRSSGRRNFLRQAAALCTIYPPTQRLPQPATVSACFAFYSSNDLACMDLDGNLLWYRGLAYDRPKAGNDVGMSSSPVVANGIVVAQVEK